MNVELEWNEFLPLSGSLIGLPENVHFWRGYSLNYPILSERPTYFGPKMVATGYAELSTNTPRELGCFKTTKPIRLLDYRYMKTLLSTIFQTYPSNDLIVMATIYAFGLGSCYHQLQMAKRFYNIDSTHPGIKNTIDYYNTFASNIIEPEGVRIAETNNDGQVMMFLSELFKDLCDGFIVPRIKTPYHHEKKGMMTEEIIIFNPIRSGIVKTLPPHTLTLKSVNDYIRKFHREVLIEYKHGKLPLFVTKHCGGSVEGPPLKDHPLNAFNELLDNNDSHTIHLAKEAIRVGKKMRRRVHCQYVEAPHPQMPVRDWTDCGESLFGMRRRSISPFSTRSKSPSRR